MPWRETDPMTERMQFITAYLSQSYSMTELCERFGIGRNTGYKWVRRITALSVSRWRWQQPSWRRNGRLRAGGHARSCPILGGGAPSLPSLRRAPLARSSSVRG